MKNWIKVLFLLIKNIFYKQHKDIVNISVKRSQIAVPRRSIFFASHSVNLSLFIKSLKTFWISSNIEFYTKYSDVYWSHMFIDPMTQLVKPKFIRNFGFLSWTWKHGYLCGFSVTLVIVCTEIYTETKDCPPPFLDSWLYVAMFWSKQSIPPIPSLHFLMQWGCSISTRAFVLLDVTFCFCSRI